MQIPQSTERQKRAAHTAHAQVFTSDMHVCRCREMGNVIVRRPTLFEMYKMSDDVINTNRKFIRQRQH